jgi:hypothetical protein
MPFAVRIDEFRKVIGDARQRVANVGVVHVDDVIDQTVHRPADRLGARGGIGRQRAQRIDHGLGIRAGEGTGVTERTASAAAEVDPEIFEDRGGSIVVGDDVADCCGVKRCGHAVLLEPDQHRDRAAVQA